MKKTLENIKRLIGTIRQSTRPVSGHGDPASIQDCWNELSEQVDMLAHPSPYQPGQKSSIDYLLEAKRRFPEDTDHAGTLTVHALQLQAQAHAEELEAFKEYYSNAQNYQYGGKHLWETDEGTFTTNGLLEQFRVSRSGKQTEG